MTHQSYLVSEAKAWLKRKHGPDEVVKIIPDLKGDMPLVIYLLYTAYDQQPEYLGRILFDTNGYWIYDGDILKVEEQEQIANFIVHLTENA